METYRQVSTVNEGFRVGDIISFEMKDGEKCDVMVAAADQEKALCVFRDCVGEGHAMNEEDTNEGGWLECDMRRYLNKELIEKLPNDVRARLQQDDNGDYLRLLDEKELFGEEKYSIFEDERNLRALEHKGAECFEWFWTRTPHSSANFGLVYSGGHLDGVNGASNVYGVRPAFLISQSGNPMSEDIEETDSEPEIEVNESKAHIAVRVSNDGCVFIDID